MTPLDTNQAGPASACMTVLSSHKPIRYRGVVRRATWFCATPIMLPCGLRWVIAGSVIGS
jgi:hypothetical protein